MTRNDVQDTTKRLMKRYEVSQRSVYRIVSDAKKGKGITYTASLRPKIDTHEFLTAGIFKQGMTWKQPIPSYS